MSESGILAAHLHERVPEEALRDELAKLLGLAVSASTRYEGAAFEMDTDRRGTCAPAASRAGVRWPSPRTTASRRWR